MEENEEEIEKIRSKIQSRNPHAFQTKLKVADEENEQKLDITEQDDLTKKQHIKGCNCKKSQ